MDRTEKDLETRVREERTGVLGTLGTLNKPLRMMPIHPEGGKRFTVREWSKKCQDWIFVTRVEGK
jgi:hypothetical protein